MFEQESEAFHQDCKIDCAYQAVQLFEVVLAVEFEPVRVRVAPRRTL